MASHTLQPPTGLRDFYPQDLLRRRYIEKLWRDTSIRHGFEEIDGPTFEHVELYKVKSGEGILNEMFGVFSGKDEAQRAAAGKGEAPYALRAEFTPTLARMYASKANALPKPTKWFWMQNCFRAEKPQRGRLREFGQWNCDIIGSENDPKAQARADADVAACALSLLTTLGFEPGSISIHFNNRLVLSAILSELGIDDAVHPSIFDLLDQRKKLTPEAFAWAAAERGVTKHHIEAIDRLIADTAAHGWSRVINDVLLDDNTHTNESEGNAFFDLLEELKRFDMEKWWRVDFSIARGLAYYTGMVFEVLADGERAIAGGGRYDNLIELFGGPATPAVGFGMGDVVLGNLLQDKGLMPEGRDLLNALSAPAASFRPDAFVISNGTPESDAKVRPLVAKLRRGTESKAWLEKSEARKPWDADRYQSADPQDGGAARPLHARHTYKTTKNVGKLLKEGADQHARFTVILESAEHATLKNLDTKEETKDIAIENVPREIARRL